MPCCANSAAGKQNAEIDNAAPQYQAKRHQFATQKEHPFFALKMIYMLVFEASCCVYMKCDFYLYLQLSSIVMSYL
jgi:hypothetical protein